MNHPPTILFRYAQLLGATLFERHVGLENACKSIKLNNYSLNPLEVEEWLTALSRSKRILGTQKAAHIATILKLIR